MGQLSDLFEGDIDDVWIFEKSGMRDLKPYDLLLAYCGFPVRKLLNHLQVELKGRKSLSAAKEL